MQAMENIAQLQPDHDEDETVEEKRDHFPKICACRRKRTVWVGECQPR